MVIRNVDTTIGTNKKLIPKFKGPYVVHKTLPNDRYIVTDIENCQLKQIPYQGVIESARLRLWVELKQKNNSTEPKTIDPGQIEADLSARLAEC